ncbi:hypothetical protein [Sinisalibacter aestuarii]|uniref:DUF2384 domain-containing protein n=1 Tax=Sinisalibacter aestuarii TaxID=2949426 RepID=A0ABQ5LWU2_9RHOB|nr:hypothetical protein [Sinisalibacter aestuarii]GKY89449.1 hypothetical protein STA1M1_33180 [Sinisalibacter aestuarii]
MNQLHMTPVARNIEDLSKDGGLKGTDIANITSVSKATVSRWKSGSLNPQPKNELVLSDLHYVVQRLRDFYTSAEIRAWLYARHPQLSDERAIDLIHEGRTEDVLKVINRLAAEVFL